MPLEEQKNLKGFFTKENFINVLKGAGIAATGTFALYILNWTTTLDLGVYTPLVAGIVPILVNAIKEWLRKDK